MILNSRQRLRMRVMMFFVLLALGYGRGKLFAAPQAERIVLSNQLVVIVQQEHSLPFVTIQLLVNAGSSRDGRGKEGLAHLTAKGLLLGTKEYTDTAMQEELDFMGAAMNSSADRDFAALGLRVLKKNLDKGFDLFMEALTQPLFPDAEIHREAENTLAAIQAAEDRPEVVAEKTFRNALYSEGPYAHPVEGTRQSLPTLSREDLLTFYRAYYHPNNSILVVVGDITPSEVEARLLSKLKSWSADQIPDAEVKTTFVKGPQTLKIDRDLTQTNVVLGSPGISRGNPDYYAVTVMNYVLGGGGFASRLLEEIRNKKGLAYSVASFFETGRYPGSFQIVLQTKNSSAREAISLARQQMERMRREGISESELEAAKRYLIGSFPLRLDTQAKMADLLAQLQFYRLGLDYAARYPALIKSVTREDVMRVARAYLHPDGTTLVLVGNLKEAGRD